ncbi:MAG: PKD domain-containing protein [Bacteroidetes bacterium]|nr:PKD domain-containing protein [Bacteroidota bacterium]
MFGCKQECLYYVIIFYVIDLTYLNFMKLYKVPSRLTFVLVPLLALLSCQKVPETSFTYTPTINVEAGESVHFNNTTPEENSYEWDFGDGGTSTTENPQHLYEEAGSFEVILTATNDAGSHLKSETIVINEATILSFFITDSTGTIYFKDAEVFLYTDEEEWDNFEEANLSDITNDEGEVLFMNMEPRVYYIWAFKEAAGGLWISGGWTDADDITQNETTSFTVPCHWYPEDTTKASKPYPTAKFIRR